MSTSMRGFGSPGRSSFDRPKCLRQSSGAASPCADRAHVADVVTAVGRTNLIESSVSRNAGSCKRRVSSQEGNETRATPARSSHDRCRRHPCALLRPDRTGRADGANDSGLSRCAGNSSVAGSGAGAAVCRNVRLPMHRRSRSTASRLVNVAHARPACAVPASCLPLASARIESSLSAEADVGRRCADSS